MTGGDGVQMTSHSKERNVLFFEDLTLSISEWIPFGQNAIETINDTLDSRKGLKDSLLTGKVDEVPESSSFDIKPFFTRVTIEDSPYLVCGRCDARERIPIFEIEEIPYATSAVFPDLWLPD